MQSLFNDSTDDEDDVIDLDEVDAVAQKARAETKVQMAAKKAQAAEDAAAKTKAEAQKKADRAKVLAETIKASEPPALKAGMKVNARWNENDEMHGRWFDGVIKSVNKKKKTVHVVFDDGDEDTDLIYAHVSVLDEGDSEKKG